MRSTGTLASSKNGCASSPAGLGLALALVRRDRDFLVAGLLGWNLVEGLTECALRRIGINQAPFALLPEQLPLEPLHLPTELAHRSEQRRHLLTRERVRLECGSVLFDRLRVHDGRAL